MAAASVVVPLLAEESFLFPLATDWCLDSEVVDTVVVLVAAEEKFLVASSLGERPLGAGGFSPHTPNICSNKVK